MWTAKNNAVRLLNFFELWSHPHVKHLLFQCCNLFWFWRVSCKLGNYYNLIEVYYSTRILLNVQDNKDVWQQNSMYVKTAQRLDSIYTMHVYYAACHIQTQTPHGNVPQLQVPTYASSNPLLGIRDQKGRITLVQLIHNCSLIAWSNGPLYRLESWRWSFNGLFYLIFHLHCTSCHQS